MIRRLPIIPTILVIAAAGTMVWLGIWQLGRAEEKEALLAAYAQATTNTDAVAFPVGEEGADKWFRRSTLDCADVLEISAVAGTATNGRKGWARRATCALSGTSETALIDLGFSIDPAISEPWAGGEVEGIIAPGPRLVADPAVAELQPLAKPDPNDLPNNHLSYAVQWFFFALTALAIYCIAVRSRLNRREEDA